MRYIVLYAAGCPACSKVARLVNDASVTGLEARSFEDPQVTGPLANEGLAVPDRPSLMVVGDAGVRVLSGWAMRRQLASVVGWRRSRTIARLLAAEWRARLTKVAAGSAPSRRGAIAGILAGVAGWAMASGTANASSGPAGAPAAAPADAARVLKTATAQQAIRAWGRADQEVLQSGGTDPVLVLVHPDRGIYTFIDNSPGALSGGQPTAISVGMAPSPEHALRYYTVDGDPLADLKFANGQVTATAIQAGTGGEASSTAVPQGIKAAAACFTVCVTGHTDPSEVCYFHCSECVTYVVGSMAQIAQCTLCIICAGKKGVPCYKACKYLL